MSDPVPVQPEFDPEEVEQIAQSPDNSKNRIVKEILAWLPDDFVAAHHARQQARWENELTPDTWWPMYDDDNDSWHETAFEVDYSTEDGVLSEDVWSLDRDGDRDYMESAEVGTPDWVRLQRELSGSKFHEAMIEYYDWVAHTGEDPLDYLGVRTTRKVDHKWLVGIKRIGTRGKFVVARKILDNPPSPPMIKRLSQVPKEVREYMNFDAKGYTQDPWAEIEPHLSDARQNTIGYTHVVTVDFNTVEPIEDVQERVKAAAATEAEREREDAAEARRQEIKIEMEWQIPMPESVGESEIDPEEVEQVAQSEKGRWFSNRMVYAQSWGNDPSVYEVFYVLDGRSFFCGLIRPDPTGIWYQDTYSPGGTFKIRKHQSEDMGRCAEAVVKAELALYGKKLGEAHPQIGESEEFDPEEVEQVARQPEADFEGMGFAPEDPSQRLQDQERGWERWVDTFDGGDVKLLMRPSAIYVRRYIGEVWWLYRDIGELVCLDIKIVPAEKVNAWVAEQVTKFESEAGLKEIQVVKADHDRYLERGQQRAMGEAAEPDPEEVEQVAGSVPPRWVLQWEDPMRRRLGIYFEGHHIGDYCVEISHRGGDPLKHYLMKAIQRLEARRPYEHGAGWVNFWDWYWHVRNQEEFHDA